MIKVDLHVHSNCSRHPSEWFLQRIGASESYTEIDEVYRLAKKRGMNFVTLTDHNTIEGAQQLAKRYPDECFISMEVTTYFPENGCKIHVLVYDITPEQADEIQKARHSIYELRDYLREQDIACSVAHATYNINGRLSSDILEKLILLFDVFEGINGARSRHYNNSWVQILQNLTPNDIDRLYRKHRIDPWNGDSWIKGFTGGSDDHSGLFIAETCTMAETTSLPDLIQRIKSRETWATGRYGNHKTLAFAIYKIACDYSRTRGSENSGALSMVNSLFFEDSHLGLKNWLAMQKFKRRKDSRDKIIVRFIDDLIANRPMEALNTEEQINRIYSSLATLSDDFFSMIASSLERDLRNGNAGKLLKNVSAALPMAFLAAPFFTTMRHLHRGREMLRELQQRFGVRQPRDKRLLWFSDTVTDLNGVSVTMRELAHCAHRSGRPLKLVTSLPDDEAREKLPPHTINLPCIYTYTPDFYNAWTLRIPSMLRAIDLIAAENPDEIVISTPGPVGVIGLLAAHLLDIKCTGIYHTDFTRQADYFIGDESVSGLIEMYTRAFFKMVDEIRVPTDRYIDMLEQRGLDPARMKIFRRSLDPSFRRCPTEETDRLRRELEIGDGPVLLWTGRLGKEKNLEFLMSIVEQVQQGHPDTHMLFVGNGPELEPMQQIYQDNPRIIFAGRREREELPVFYSMADLFVFPSTTDTFGMVVLEAQACGLPALVTDVGGPQEIVHHGDTGQVIKAADREAWTQAILSYLDLRLADPEGFEALRRKTADRFHAKHGWQALLDDMMGPAPTRHFPEPVDASPQPSEPACSST